MNKFKYKCICDWSKDDEYGFIPNTECPVHGKQTKKMLKNTIPIKSQQIKKNSSDGSDTNYLETRNTKGVENKQEHKSGRMDTQSVGNKIKWK